MNEYISKEFMLKNLEADKMNNAEHCEPVTVQIMERFIRYIKEFPAADVQPIRRGRWMTSHPVDIAKEFKCTTCGGLVELPVFAKKCYYDFCPNCGARMDGDTECK